MRLTLENFFSYLIFFPLRAITKKDKAIALIATIACALFSAGICHAVCGIRRCCIIYRPSGQTSFQDGQIARLKGSILQSGESTTVSSDLRTGKPNVSESIVKIGEPVAELGLRSSELLVAESIVDADKPVVELTLKSDEPVVAESIVDADKPIVELTLKSDELVVAESIVDADKPVVELTLKSDEPVVAESIVDADKRAVTKLILSTSESTATQSHEKPETQVKSSIVVNIAPEVKKTLDQLFKGSPYSINDLPVYPIILNRSHGAPLRKEMTAPVMKGKSNDGRAFIAIKVNCNLRKEDIEKHPSFPLQVSYDKVYCQVKDVLVLYQYTSRPVLNWGGSGMFLWDELGRGQSLGPSFFTWNFTYAEDGSGPTESQVANFKQVQMLLSTGKLKIAMVLFGTFHKNNYVDDVEACRLGTPKMAFKRKWYEV